MSHQRLTLIAPVNSFTGWGMHAIQTVRDLQRLAGCYVSIRARSRDEAFGATIPADIAERLVNGPQVEPGELILSPPQFACTPGKETAYFTMWESTRLPPYSPGILNQAKVVIVPSSWCASVFSASGVTAPLRVVPLGVSPAFGFRTPNKPDQIVFGAAGRARHGRARKGLDSVIQAFVDEFPNEKDVCLVVKCFPDCEINDPGDPRVVITRQYMNEGDLANWFAGLTCFVSAARGEGWGLMQHQAMSIGRPVIAPIYGGLAEFMTPQNSYACQYKLAPATEGYRGCGHWAEPDLDHMRRLMREVYDHPTKAMEKGCRASQEVAALTWENSSRRLISVLEEYGLLQRERKHGKCIIQLGRVGDIINILSVAHQHFEQDGAKPALMVAKEYAGVLDGVDYVEKEVLDIDFRRVQPALTAAQKYDQPILAQVYAIDHPGLRAQGYSFSDQSFSRAGGKPGARLVFDHRDYTRERELAWGCLDASKPNVLLHLGGGNSSPYPYAAQLKEYLEGHCRDVNFVDLNAIRAERIYDLLGLMDRAVMMVTDDSAPLHLAAASNVPVIALITDKPTPWHGTNPRCNTVLWLRYQASKERFSQIAATINTHYPVNSRILHCFSEHLPSSPAARRRYETASRTWDQLYTSTWTTSMPIHDHMLRRMFDDGDRRLPYVKDLISLAIEQTDRMDDIILLTNRDTCLVPSFGDILAVALRRSDCAYAYRWDHPYVAGSLSMAQVRKGRKYPGSDLFAFRASWWRDNRAKFPDLLLATEAWDWCLRELMRQDRGVDLGDVIYHEIHDNQWCGVRTRQGRKSQQHNLALAKRFLEELGIDTKGLGEWI